jgi:hypothetical protein
MSAGGSLADIRVLGFRSAQERTSRPAEAHNALRPRSMIPAPFEVPAALPELPPPCIRHTRLPVDWMWVVATVKQSLARLLTEFRKFRLIEVSLTDGLSTDAFGR